MKLSVVISGLLAGVSMPCIALAQSTTTPLPVRTYVDGNGVDLFSGMRVVDGPTLTSGPDDRVSYRDIFFQGRSLSSIQGAIVTNGSIATVAIGPKSERFVITGSDSSGNTLYQPAEAKGSTLTESGIDYVYKTSDGTTYAFQHPNSCCQVVYRQWGDNPVIKSIKYKDGLTVNYNWQNFQITVGQTPGGLIKADVRRVATISSNSGYTLFLEYKKPNPSPSPGDFYDAITITKVTGFNISVDNCNNLECTQTPNSTGSRPYLLLGSIYDGSRYLSSATAISNDNKSTSVTASTVQKPDSSATYTYDSSSRVATVASAGITTTYGYADSGDVRTVTVASAGAPARALTFNIGQSTLRSVADETNRKMTYEYDASARVTRIIAPEGDFTTLGYDGRGNVTSTIITGKTGSTLSTSASYPCSIAAACNSPVSTTDARNNTTNYDYDTTSGLPTKVTLPSAANGVRPEQRIGYTQIGGIWRPTSISQCMSSAPGNCSGGSDEVKTTIGYAGNAGLAASVMVAAGDNSVSATSAMTYDDMGHQMTEDGPLPGGDDTTRYYYDSVGNPLGSVGPDPDGGGPLLRKAVRTNYNSAGQIASIDTGTATDQGDLALTNMTVLQSVVTAYDTNNRPVAQSASASGTIYAYTQTGYDSRGRVVCRAIRMNPSAFTATSDACALGTQGSDGPDRIVRTNYDDANRVLSVVNAWGTAEASTESSSYTANGKIASLTDGNGNVTAFAYDGFDRLATTTYPGGSYEQLGYDAGGNVTSRRLRDGQVIGYGYDNLNRITSKTPPSPENPVSYSYNLLGGVTVVSRPADGVTQSFAYDALGRLLSETQPFGSAAYQYDAAGRRTRLTWSDGNYVTYDYFATGDVSAIRESGSGLLASYGYDSLGRRTSLTRGNGTVTSYGYDAASRLNSLTHDLGGTAYDSTTSFSHNPASQIASQTRSNDAYAWTGALNVDRGYGVNALNQLTSAGGTSLGYDARGNLTTSGNSRYAYTAENLMKASPSATMYYDALGRLVEYDTTVSTRFVYDGGHIAAEVANPSGAIQRRYVFGPGDDEPLVWYEGNGLGDRRWLVADERGSVVATTNESGTVMGVNSYDEYGIPSSANLGRFQYTGQVWLPELGMSYYKARIYSPALGRFMQTDPIGYGDGMNLYNYVGSDPINLRDPTGLFACPEGQFPVYASNGQPGRFTGNEITVELPHTCVFAPGPFGRINIPCQTGANCQIDRSTDNDIVVTAPQSGHYYDVTEKICRAPLSQAQRGQVNRATALPDGTINPGRTAGTYPVGGALFGVVPIIGGYVTTRFSADGNIAVNTTTSAHLFVGTITRTIYSNSGGTFIRTVGSGNAGSGIIGRTRDEINGAAGPGIFRDANGLARDYAKELNSSC